MGTQEGSISKRRRKIQKNSAIRKKKEIRTKKKGIVFFLLVSEIQRRLLLYKVSVESSFNLKTADFFNIQIKIFSCFKKFATKEGLLYYSVTKIVIVIVD